MSLSKIKSTFYNKFRLLLAISVLLSGSSAYSQLCIDSFKAPKSLETALNFNNIEQAQHHALLYVSRLAKNIAQAQDIQQRQKYILELQQTWDRLRQDSRSFTLHIVNHFENRLRQSLMDQPLLHKRLYGDYKDSLFSVLNFHYQLPFVILSLKLEDLRLKEINL